MQKSKATHSNGRFTARACKRPRFWCLVFPESDLQEVVRIARDSSGRFQIMGWIDAFEA